MSGSLIRGVVCYSEGQSEYMQQTKKQTLFSEQKLLATTMSSPSLSALERHDC